MCFGAAVLSGARGRLEEIARAAPPRRGAAFGQAQRLRRRRRHQGIHRPYGRPRHGYALVRGGQSVLEQLEYLPCPSVAADPRLRARRRSGTRAGLPLSDRRRRRQAVASGCRRCSSASTPDSAARCGRCGCIGVRPALELMLKGKPFERQTRARDRSRSTGWCRAAELGGAAKAPAAKPAAAAHAAPLVERC